MKAHPKEVTGEPSLTKRLLYFVTFALVVIFIIGLTYLAIRNDLSSRFNAEPHPPTLVAAQATLTTVASLTQDRAFPMGITFDKQGVVLLSQFGNGQISRLVEPDKLDLWRTPGVAVGALATAPNGDIYAIVYDHASDRGAGQIYRLGQAEATLEATLESLPLLPTDQHFRLFAQLAFDHNGILYATDASSATIWRYDQPDRAPTRFWTAAPVSGRAAQLVGLAFEPTTNSLLVTDVGTGSLYRVSIAGQTELLLHRDGNISPFAVTADEQGHIFLLEWDHDNGVLSVLNSDGSLLRIAEGFRLPSAVIVRNYMAYVVNSGAIGLLQGGVIVKPDIKPPFTVDRIDYTAVPFK